MKYYILITLSLLAIAISEKKPMENKNLKTDESGEPIKHPLINEIFSGKNGSSYFKPSN